MIFRLNEDFSFEIDSKTGVVADKIYCKATGENTAVFATLASGYTIGGSVRLFSQGLYEFPTESLGLPDDLTISWNDIAVGYVDGNDVTGVDLRGCTDVGCEIEMYDLNGNGVDEVVVRSRDKNVTIVSGERTWAVKQKEILRSEISMEMVSMNYWSMMKSLQMTLANTCGLFLFFKMTSDRSMDSVRYPLS